MLNVQYVSMLNTLQKQQQKLPAQSLGAFISLLLVAPARLHLFLYDSWAVWLAGEVTWYRWRWALLHFVKFLAFHETYPSGEHREGQMRMHLQSVQSAGLMMLQGLCVKSVAWRSLKLRDPGVQAPLQRVREGTKAHLTLSIRGTEQNPQPRAGCLGVTEEPQHASRWWEDGWVVLRGNPGSMPASRDITHDLCRELVTCLGLTENMYLCCFT